MTQIGISRVVTCGIKRCLVPNWFTVAIFTFQGPITIKRATSCGVFCKTTIKRKLVEAYFHVKQMTFVTSSSLLSTFVGCVDRYKAAKLACKKWLCVWATRLLLLCIRHKLQQKEHKYYEQNMKSLQRTTWFMRKENFLEKWAENLRKVAMYKWLLTFVLDIL